MDKNGYRQYKEQREQTISAMTPAELLMLLYDELIKRLVIGDLALGKEDYPGFEAAMDRCMDILRYLDDTLDPQYPISAELHRLYDFFLYDLSRIKMGRNKAELDKVRPLLTELRDTFRAAAKNSAPQAR